MRACLFTCNRTEYEPTPTLASHLQRPRPLHLPQKTNKVNNLISQAITARQKRNKSAAHTRCYACGVRGVPTAPEYNTFESLAILAWQPSVVHDTISPRKMEIYPSFGACAAFAESRGRGKENIAHAEYQNVQTSHRPLARGYHVVLCSFPRNPNHRRPCHHPRMVLPFRVQGCSHGWMPGWRWQVVPAASRVQSAPYRV
jgi:hypothetical protein